MGLVDGVKHKVSEYNQAISSAQTPKAALRILARLRWWRLEPTVVTFNSLAAVCGRRAWEEGLHVLGQGRARGLCDLVSYNTAAAWSWRLALDFLSQGLEPDVVTYNSSMGVESEAWSRALQVRAEVWTRGLQPTAVTHNVAINACAKHCWRNALLIFEELQEESRSDATSKTYTAVMGACVTSGRWQPARELLEDMRAARMSHGSTHTLAIDACGKASEWQQALGLLLGMEAFGLPQNLVAFNAAINACAESSHWQHATLLLEEMKRKTLRSDAITQTSLTDACAQAQQWQHAMSLVVEAQVLTLGANKILNNAAMSACEKGLWRQAALLAFPKPTRYGCNVHISALGREEHWSRALQSLHTLSQLRLQSDEGSCVPVLACQAWRRAQRLLDAPLLRAALGASGAARNAVVSRLAKGGEWRRALQGLDAKDALQPDEVTFICNIRAEKARWQRVLLLLQAQDFQSTEVFSACIFQISDWRVSLILLEDMTKQRIWPDDWTMHTAIRTCTRWEQVLRLVGRAPSERVMELAIEALMQGDRLGQSAMRPQSREEAPEPKDQVRSVPAALRGMVLSALPVPTGRRKALVIGCGYFESSMPLAGAMNDAWNVLSLLRHTLQFPESQVRFLVDGTRSCPMPVQRRPTAQTIAESLQWLTHDAQPGDQLFLYYAGYGLLLPHGVGSFESCLVPIDFAVGAPGAVRETRKVNRDADVVQLSRYGCGDFRVWVQAWESR
ncbi:unnamed protein product [Effrenium voratum]|nr:unnamed protein product [Effrenium voratum]